MDKSYIIFGGSGTLGEYLSKSLLEKNNCFVWASYFQKKNRNANPKLNYFYYSATQPLSKAVTEEILKSNIAGIVFAIGMPSSKNDIVNTSQDEWSNIFNVNVMSFINCIKPFKSILFNKGMRIVVVSSSAAKDNKAKSAPYSMSKNALESVALSLSKELDEASVNILRPSMFISDMAYYIAQKKGYQDFDKYIAEVLEGKILSCTQVGEMVLKMLIDEQWQEKTGFIVEMDRNGTSTIINYFAQEGHNYD